MAAGGVLDSGDNCFVVDGDGGDWWRWLGSRMTVMMYDITGRVEFVVWMVVMAMVDRVIGVACCARWCTVLIQTMMMESADISCKY